MINPTPELLYALVLILVPAHYLGDYGFQNGWMALNKRNRWLPAIVHGLVYGMAIALTGIIFGSPKLLEPFVLLFAIGSHIIIDHYALGSVWYRLVNGFLKTRNDELQDWQKPICLAIDQGMHFWCNAIAVVFFG